MKCLEHTTFKLEVKRFRDMRSQLGPKLGLGTDALWKDFLLGSVPFIGSAANLEAALSGAGRGHLPVNWVGGCCNALSCILLIFTANLGGDVGDPLFGTSLGLLGTSGLTNMLRE